MGGKEWTHASASAASGSVAAPAPGYMSAIEPSKGGVGRIWLADGTAALGSATSLIVSQSTITWQNALQMVKGEGSSGPSAIDRGGVDGSNVNARVRFDDAARTAVADLIEAHTTMQWAKSVRDIQGNRMLWFVPAGKPSGDISFGARGSVVYQPVTIGSHDPAKDETSIYHAAGAGLGFQHAMFYVPAA
jgi:hypothetical protein